MAARARVESNDTSTRRARRRPAPVLLAALAGLVLLAPACGSDEADATPAAESAGSGPLEFTAPLVGGGTFDGAAYADRPVAFWFWAPT